MKKLLLSSAAVCGLVLAAGQAQAADGLKLDIGGWFKGYGAYVDQDTVEDDPATVANEDQEERNFDILRNTEIHFTGETTLDNGLTVGMHFETEADNNDSLDVEESYAYFTGTWGRVNFGAENGASYLLQVEAPSADSNVDGIRQFIDGTNYSIAPGTMGTFFNTGLTAVQISNGANGVNNTGGDDIIRNAAVNFNTSGSGAAFDLFSFDYDDDVTGYANKITYLTPIFAGFQAGVSYTPENNDTTASDDTTGVGIDDQAGTYGSSYEVAVRYEGQFDQVGVIAGVGFTHSNVEESQVLIYEDNDNDNVLDDSDDVLSKRDDRQSWNAGLDLDFGPFGLGVAYVHDDLGIDGLDADRETFVVGADYTTGPFKLGASYYNQDQELDGFLGAGGGDLETDRYTGGVVYTYGPGMTFRGSVSFIDHDLPNSNDVDSTNVLLGTQINF
ncbi:MAG: porin [Alphaproteobacteria bacterium]|nr:porin [Alphaproteobacteria bacterium]